MIAIAYLILGYASIVLNKPVVYGLRHDTVSLKVQNNNDHQLVFGCSVQTRINGRWYTSVEDIFLPPFLKIQRLATVPPHEAMTIVWNQHDYYSKMSAIDKRGVELIKGSDISPSRFVLVVYKNEGSDYSVCSGEFFLKPNWIELR